MTNYLAQIIAVEADRKKDAAHELNQAQNLLGNKGPFTGITRAYTSSEEDGEPLPAESTRVQQRATQVIKGVQKYLVSLFDVVATKDYTNCVAKADITIDGKILLPAVPATYILFLEKQLAELLNFAKKLPVLDPAFSWQYDQTSDCWSTPPVETVRTKKIKKSQTVFEGNQHHAPQFLVWDEDKKAGTWSTIHYSGAMQQSEINAIIERIEKLQKAVKFAREAANRQEVTQQHMGETVLHYLFG